MADGGSVGATVAGGFGGISSLGGAPTTVPTGVTSEGRVTSAQSIAAANASLAQQAAVSSTGAPQIKQQMTPQQAANLQQGLAQSNAARLTPIQQRVIDVGAQIERSAEVGPITSTFTGLAQQAEARANSPGASLYDQVYGRVIASVFRGPEMTAKTGAAAGGVILTAAGLAAGDKGAQQTAAVGVPSAISAVVAAPTTPEFWVGAALGFAFGVPGLQASAYESSFSGIQKISFQKAAAPAVEIKPVISPSRAPSEPVLLETRAVPGGTLSVYDVQSTAKVQNQPFVFGRPVSLPLGQAQDYVFRGTAEVFTRSSPAQEGFVNPMLVESTVDTYGATRATNVIEAARQTAPRYSYPAAKQAAPTPGSLGAMLASDSEYISSVASGFAKDIAGARQSILPARPAVFEPQVPNVKNAPAPAYTSAATYYEVTPQGRLFEVAAAPNAPVSYSAEFGYMPSRSTISVSPFAQSRVTSPSGAIGLPGSNLAASAASSLDLVFGAGIEKARSMFSSDASYIRNIITPAEEPYARMGRNINALANEQYGKGVFGQDADYISRVLGPQLKGEAGPSVFSQDLDYISSVFRGKAETAGALPQSNLQPGGTYAFVRGASPKPGAAIRFAASRMEPSGGESVFSELIYGRQRGSLPLLSRGQSPRATVAEAEIFGRSPPIGAVDKTTNIRPSAIGPKTPLKFSFEDVLEPGKTEVAQGAEKGVQVSPDIIVKQRAAASAASITDTYRQLYSGASRGPDVYGGFDTGPFGKANIAPGAVYPGAQIGRNKPADIFGFIASPGTTGKQGSALSGGVGNMQGQKPGAGNIQAPKQSTPPSFEFKLKYSALDIPDVVTTGETQGGRQRQASLDIAPELPTFPTFAEPVRGIPQGPLNLRIPNINLRDEGGKTATRQRVNSQLRDVLGALTGSAFRRR